MTCSPVEEHHLWEASSTGAASLGGFMAVMCLEIRMGKYEKGLLLKRRDESSYTTS